MIAHLAEAAGGRGVDVRQVGGKGPHHFLVGSKAPDVGGRDGQGVVALLLQPAPQMELDVFQPLVHLPLHAVRTGVMSGRDAAQFHACVRVVNRDDHHITTLRPMPVGAHLGRRLRPTLHGAHAHQVRAQSQSFGLEGGGQRRACRLLVVTQGGLFGAHVSRLLRLLVIRYDDSAFRPGRGPPWTVLVRNDTGFYRPRKPWESSFRGAGSDTIIRAATV